MTVSRARRILPACVLGAVAAAAAAAPGAANAALLKQCGGSNIAGAGSSLQQIAQEKVWSKDFNSSKDSAACSGKQGTKQKPEVTYATTSSGKGYKAWHEKHEFGVYGFIGTDNTVNQSEKEALEGEVDFEGLTSEVLTVPVAQSAVAIVINLPEGCLAESAESTAKGRLVLSQKALEGIYAGSVTKWSQLTEGGDKLVQNPAEGEPVCNPETAIQPVVRKDASGTTHIFKRFLNWTEPGALATSKGAKTWNELSELENSTLWPEAIKPLEGEKSPGLLEKVSTTPGSIGYAVLADSREKGFAPPSGGPGTQKFWAEVESSVKSGKPVYADPSENGDVEAVSNSNCKKTVYTNGKASFPPPSVKSTWNEVTTERYSKSYAICGLTYDLALTNYAAYKGWGTSQGEATTVENYLAYVTAKAGGQKEIKNHDYLALPSAVLAKADEAPGLINWVE